MEEVTIPIRLDDSGFSAGSKRVVEQMEKASAEVKKTGLSTDDYSKRMEGLLGTMEKLSASIERNTSAMEKNGKAGKTASREEAKGAEEATDAIEKTTAATERLGGKLRDAGNEGAAGFDNIKRAAMGFFTVTAAKEFVSDVFAARKEMESLETSFRVLLGNKEAAQALTDSIREYAVKTPMQMNELADSAKQMLGFGVPLNEIMENLKAIGDVSMGDSEKFKSLSLAFSQMSATGKLMGQDLMQMVNAGFNPLEQMAQTTGKSIGKLKDEMSAGAISAEMVRQAFIDATSEGGKYYGMLEEQSKTLAGAYSNLEGAVNDALSEIGANTESVMKGAIDIGTTLAKNYETVGKVLMTLVATYGSYKTAVVGVSVVTDLLNGKYTLKIRLLRSLAAAQQLLNKTMLANPYVAAATAVLSIASALVIFRNRAGEATEAQKQMNATFSDTQAEMAAEQKQIDALFEKLKKAEKGTNEYRDVKQKILDQYGGYLSGLGKEIATLADVEGAYKAVAKAAREAALARGKEAALGEANKNYGENYSSSMGKLRGVLKDKVGEAETSKALRKIQKELRETGTISKKTEMSIRGLLRGDFSYGTSAVYFTSLRNNEKELKEAVKEADELFQTEEKHAEKTTTKVKTLGQAYKEAEDAYKSASKKIEEIKKNRSKYTEKDWEDAQEDLKTKKKIYEDLGGDPDGKQSRKDTAEARKELTELKKSINERKKLQETMRKQELEAKRNGIDALLDAEQAEIDTMAEGTDKSLRQIRLDSKRKAEELERQYEDLKQKKIDNARALFEADSANEGKEFDTSSVNTEYTDAEIKQYEERKKAIQQETRKLLSEQADSEEEAMLSYLQMYGTFQEQKLAIAREYSKKIANVQSSSDSDETKTWKTEKLRKEESAAQSAVEANAIAAKIDWYSVFDNLGLVVKSQLEPLLKQLKDFSGTDKFKTLGADQQKVIVDAMEKIRGQIGTSDVDFHSLANDIVEYQQALTKQREAEEAYNDILLNYTPKLEEANNDLDIAKNTGNEEAIKAAQTRVNEITNIITDAGTAYSDATSAVTTSGSKLQKTAKAVIQPMSEIGTFLSTSGLTQLSELWGAFEQLKGGIDGLKALSEADKAAKGLSESGKEISNGVEGAAESLGEVGDVVTDSLSEGLSKAGLIGQIVAAVLQILDILKDGIGTLISSLIDTVLGAIDGLLKNILSGKFIEQIGESLISGLGNIIDTVTGALGSVLSFGLLSSDGISSWFTNSNAKEVAETTEKLTKMNERLAESIDKLSENISKVNGARAIEEAEAAQKANDEMIKNQRKILIAQMEYHSAHHSNAAYWADGDGTKLHSAINSAIAEYDRKNGTTSKTVREWKDLASQSPEVLDYIRTYYPELWSQIVDVGKYDKSEYWDALADLAGMSQEITDTLNESLTQVSFDSLRSDFFSSLMDMEHSAEDFSNDFSEMMAKAMLNAAIGNIMDEELKKFYEDWAALMKTREDEGGQLTETDIQGFRDRWNSLVEKGTAKRDEIFDIVGYDPTDDTNDYFGSLEDSFLSTLTSMTDDAEDWSKDIVRIMTEDLVKQLVLGEDFQKWLDDWRTRYKTAVEAGDVAGVNALKAELDSMRESLKAGASEIMDMTGFSELMAENVSGAAAAFDDLHSSFLDTLTDMESDAEEWSREITRVMVEQLVEQSLLGEAFDTWLEEWKGRFAALIEDETLTDSEKSAGLIALREELNEMRGKLSEEAQRIMDSMGYGKEDEWESPFGDLESKFVDTLTSMDKDAREWSKTIAKTMAEELIKKNVLGEKFSKWAEQWNEDYRSIMEDETMSEEERLRRLEKLRKAMEEMRDSLAWEAEGIMDAIGLTDLMEEDTTFDGMRDTFLSSLMDMESSAEDFSKTISEALAKSFIDTFVLNDQFDERLEEWKAKYASIMKNEGLTDEERAKLLKNLGEAMAETRESMSEQSKEILTMLGLGDREDQGATMNMAEAATYDQFETYLGIAMGQQMALEQGNDVRLRILEHLQGAGNITSSDSMIVKEINSRMRTANEYLLAIRNTSQEMLTTFTAHLNDIRSTLKRL
ncbi:MAG: tape measure protein [Prevotella sp.]